MKATKHIRCDFHSAAWVMPQEWDAGGAQGVKKQIVFSNTRLAIDRSLCILTRPVVITGFNRSLLVDWWSIG